MSVKATFSPRAKLLSISGDKLKNGITVSRNAAGDILVDGGAVAIDGGRPEADVLTAVGTTAFVAPLAVGELQTSVTTGTDYHDHGNTRSPVGPLGGQCLSDRRRSLPRSSRKPRRSDSLVYTPGGQLKVIRRLT